MNVSTIETTDVLFKASIGLVHCRRHLGPFLFEVGRRAFVASAESAEEPIPGEPTCLVAVEGKESSVFKESHLIHHSKSVTRNRLEQLVNV